jgi:suppressor for copper-sensitivity B
MNENRKSPFFTKTAVAALIAGLLAGLPPDAAFAQSLPQSLAVPLTPSLSKTVRIPSEGPGASDWVKNDQATLRLISATVATGDAKEIKLGLHFKLKKGWKVYWRSPGDAGYPPSINWAGSKNLKKATFSWPVPERFSILGFETLGYEKEVVLPLTVLLRRPGEAFQGRANVDYLTCSEICIPHRAKLSLDLPKGAAAASAFAHLIDRYQSRVPGDGAAEGLTITKVEAIKSGEDNGANDKAVLRVRATSIAPFAATDLFVEGPAELEFTRPKFRLDKTRKKILIETPVRGLREWAKPLAGTPLVLTLVDGKRAAETKVTVVKGQGPAILIAADKTKSTSIFIILAVAVLGGLILNLMPCVLPVLSIKLLSVVKHGGGQKRAVRLNFLATSAGIITAFLALAGILVGLKAGGAAIGWGIQFQQPWFLVAMIIVLTLFASNLWGFFEFRLPAWVARMSEHSSRGLGGHFLSGAFTMLLSTPCSAPFLGTAIGFALARGPEEIFAIFTALGLGLAVPYLLIAAAPGMATRLPRPGPWMEKLRRVLGYALAATVLWLLMVLYSQTGMVAAAAVGFLMAAAGLVLYLRHRLGAKAHATFLALAALAVTAFAAPEMLKNAGGFGGLGTADGPGKLDKAAEARLESIWVPFDRSAITKLVLTGKTVFVNVTADWCITCQVNKALVLSKGDVFKRLSSPAVIAMEADWTKPSDAISRYLASFGRYGIPFDAVYGPGAPRGLVLPELLSEKAVLQALAKARARKIK